MRKWVKWSSGYWIHGQVENWEKLDIGDYVDKVAQKMLLRKLLGEYR